MSYSRWSNSCWYTYNCATKNGPLFSVNTEEHYELSELIVNKENILDQYRKLRFDRNPLNYHGLGEIPKDRYTEDEIQELSGYIDDFIRDNEPQDNPTDEDKK